MSLVEDTYLICFYGGVTMFNLVACLYLLLRRGNAIAPGITSPVRLRRWTAAFLAVLAMSHVSWLAYILSPSPLGYMTVCCLDIFFLIPTIAGTMLSMLQDRHRPVWPVAVALIPVAAFWVLYIIRKDDSLMAPLSVYVTALYVLMMLYMLFSVRRYRRWLRDNYADLENKEIRNSFLILAVFLFFSLLYSSTTENRIFVYLLQINNIIIVGLLLWCVETLQQLNERSSPETDPAEDARKAPAPPAIPANIGPQLQKKCEDGQLYLQHDLTLSQLAQTIGTNRYYLSLYFAQQGLTFNAYINGLRVDHFLRLYREAVKDQRNFTAQKLSFESGFHSYSTFSAAFKQKTGMTVTAWMHGIAE